MKKSWLNAATGIVAIALSCAVFYAQAEETMALNQGDMVYIKVYRHDDLSTSAHVDAAGNIELPYVGKVSVSGLSDVQAGARVSKAYSAILKKAPQVTISRGFTGNVGLLAGRTEKMRTEVVSLINSDAETMYDALSGMASTGGAINFHAETNSLIVTDTPSTLQNMIAVINKLDQSQTQVTQVHIETWIAEVESGAIKELGVKWFVQGDNIGTGYNPGMRQLSQTSSARGTNDPLVNEHFDSNNNSNNQGGGYGSRDFIDDSNWDRRLQLPVQVASAGQMFLGFMNSGIDLGLFIDALVTDKKAELLATPYRTTVNHKTARIMATEQFPFTQVGSVGFSSVANVSFLDIGIILDVTPHVRRDPRGSTYIQLELEPEVSTATGVANGVPIRSVASSSGVTNVRDGQTVIIGGISQTETGRAEERVPGVSKVPLLGRLFKHKERSKKTRELMIFVTPTIIENPEDMTWERTLHLPVTDEDADLIPSLQAFADGREKD
jgi:type II secretory pathway component GspD/PulD (secretin)